MRHLLRLVLVVTVGIALGHPAVESPFYHGPQPQDVEEVVEYRLTHESYLDDVEAKCVRPLTERAFRCDLVRYATPGVVDPPRDIRLAVRVHPSAGWK